MKSFDSRPLFALAMPFVFAGLVSCAATPVEQESEPNQAVELASNNIADLVRKGDDALARREYDEAQVSYALALKEQPNNIDVLYKLSVVHFEKSSFDVAAELLANILSKSEAHAGAHEMLGLIALNKQELENVTSHFLAALNIEPQRWRSLNGMGVIKDMLGMHSEAQDYFSKALVRSPAKAKIQNNIGYSYYLEGNLDQALHYFRKSTQTNPAYEKAWANLGLVYIRKNRIEDARYAFTQVVDDHVASNNLGYLSLLQQDFHTARQELSRAIILSPTHYAIASENLATLKNKKHLNSNANIPAPSAPILPAPLNDVQTSPVVIKQASYQKPPVAKPSKKRRVQSQIDLTKQYLSFLGYSATGDDADTLKRALFSFQTSFQLEPTRRADTATKKALQVQTVQRVKVLLSSLGFTVDMENAAIDKLTSSSLRQFQQENGVKVTGKIDEQTLKVLEAL